MSRDSSKNKKPSAARRVAETALDVAVGGTALAADKALETLERVVERTESAGERRGRVARDKASTAVRAARQAVEDRDGRSYEDRTRDELYDLAAQRGIEGRSAMRKAELIAALRAER